MIDHGLQSKIARDPYVKPRNTMHFPLDVSRYNMYAVTKNDVDLYGYQCSVVVKLQGDESVSTS